MDGTALPTSYPCSPKSYPCSPNLPRPAPSPAQPSAVPRIFRCHRIRNRRKSPTSASPGGTNTSSPGSIFTSPGPVFTIRGQGPSGAGIVRGNGVSHWCLEQSIGCGALEGSRTTAGERTTTSRTQTDLLKCCIWGSGLSPGRPVFASLRLPPVLARLAVGGPRRVV